MAGALDAAAVFGGGESAAQEAGYAVRVVAADGTAGQVLGGPPVAFGPAWAPDGGRIGFIAVPAGAERGQIFSAAPDGSGLAQLSAHAQGGRFRVFTIRPDGRGVRRVGSTSCGLDPVWRPDGRRLACVGLTRRSGRPRFAVNVVGLGGRIFGSLPPGGAGAVLAAPTWSPDARRIAFGTAPASG